MYDKYKIKMGYGYYNFKLGQILKEKNITMNKLCTDLDMEYIVIKRLITGNLSRLDLAVLSRICDYLQCTLNDIIEYKS